jgi:UDPglucose 6-dehydrogenase
MRILTIGAGYVGGTTMAVMAKHNPDHDFVVVDIDRQRICEWNSDTLPIYEPGLDDIVRDARNLTFSADVRGEIGRADIIFISVDTPTKMKGVGAGYACDTSKVEDVARNINKFASGDTIVVEKTTVPVGTCMMLRGVLEDIDGKVFTILSNPEFLAEGTAIDNLERPDRVLIGGSGRSTGAHHLLASLYLKWVPDGRIILTDLWTSELSKLAANAFLAQRVSSINSLAEVCEHTGARIDELAAAIGTDPRIGPDFLKASLGFGGSCFKKDILSLVYIARSHGLAEVADYWEAVVKMNEHQQDRLVRRVVNRLFGTVKDKRIAVFGYAFKANTGDVRESPAARLCALLVEEGADVCVTDPRASLTAHGEIEGVNFSDHCHLMTCAVNAHAIIIATEWPEYTQLPWHTIKSSMERPAWLFDGRNLLDAARMRDIGFHYASIGDSSEY